eukprot:1419911-Rhodomonas_salina.5
MDHVITVILNVTKPLQNNYNERTTRVLVPHTKTHKESTQSWLPLEPILILDHRRIQRAPRPSLLIAHGPAVHQARLVTYAPCPVAVICGCKRVCVRSAFIGAALLYAPPPRPVFCDFNDIQGKSDARDGC